MSFKCDICGTTAKNGESPSKVVVQTRPRIYEFTDKEGNIVKTTHGWEVVKEVNCCVKCPGT